MGRKLTASEETQLLQDTVRAAHEVLSQLQATLRNARALEPHLVREFEDIADRQIKDLSNKLQQQNNAAAAKLNTEVERAREYIVDLLTVAKLEHIPGTSTFNIRFPAGGFDQQAPLPYPNRPAVRKET